MKINLKLHKDPPHGRHKNCVKEKLMTGTDLVSVSKVKQ